MARRALLQRLEIRSVAVFRALPLGELLCAAPALRALRAALPQARVVLAGLPDGAAFARRHPAYVDEFLPFPGHPLLPEQPVRQEALTPFYAEVCARAFDLALQLHDSGEVSNHIVAGFGARAVAGYCQGRGVRSRRTLLLPYPGAGGAEPERLLRLVEALGAPRTDSRLEFPLEPGDERELADSGLAAALEPGRYLCVHPGPAREGAWPPQRFAELADRLADEFSLAVVLSGCGDAAPPAEAVARHMRSPAVFAAPPLSPGALGALLQRARLLVCHDGLVSHIAAGLGLPSVVIFARGDIARWAPPDRRRHRCIWDPGAQRALAVLEHARALLKGTEPSELRAIGLWPYW